MFSATVAPLVAVTILDLKPSPQDTTAFYSEKIYQVLVASNVPPTSIPSTLAQPPPFSPPKYIIWVNSLWFLSLVINLSCAVLAILLQQSTRRYLKMTQHSRSNPHDQARIREFFIHGVDNFRLRWSIDALSMLLHLSIFLFFSGLLLYLFNVHHSVFYAVLSWVAASTLGYIFITAMPIFRPNCPYHAPFSILAWYLYATMVLLLLSCLSCCCSWLGNFNNLRKHYRNRISRGMEGMTKKVVQESSKEIDSRILKSVVHAPIEDHEHDRLFQCILGFCSSKIVKGPEAILRNLDRRDISSILIAHLDRTWSSNVVTKQDRIRRFVNCVKVADLARLSDVVLEILHYVFPSDELPSDNHMVLDRKSVV